MRGARSAVVMTVTAAVLAGGLTGCGSSGGGGAEGRPSPAATVPATATAATATAGGTAAGGTATAALDPEAALAAAAEVMRRAGSARYTLSGGDGSAAVPGTGFTRWADGPAVLDYLADDPGTRLRIRMAGNEAYFGPTEQVAAAVGEQVIWVKATFILWRKPFYPQLSLVMDPVNLLTLARAGWLDRVGTETVDGAEVTHYRDIEDVDAVLGGIPGLTAEHRPHAEVGLRKSGKAFVLDFWINAEQQLVRFRLTGDKEGAADAVTVTYSALGTAPAMEAPDPKDIRTSPDLDKFLGPSPAEEGPGPDAVRAGSGAGLPRVTPPPARWTAGG
ncbi:hypothetical protein [Kitasatospora sp. NPDC015120]|uniref:hypothetical protein n=1 Tax=Kitasatospora sp. NPDC015120 TaxID=3364023 RepID=UPI0036F47908